MYFNRRSTSFTTLAVAALLAAVLASTAGAASTQRQTQSAKKVSVVFVPLLAGISFYNTLSYGIQQNAKALKFSYSMQGSSNDPTPKGQTPIVNAVCSKRPTFLVIAPTDPVAMRRPIAACMKLGVKVITVDTRLKDARGIVSSIGSDDKVGGKLAADFLGRELNGQGTLAVQTFQNISTLVARDAAFRAQMKSKFPQIKLLAPQYPTSESASGTAAAAAITANPDLSGFFVNGGFFSGVVRAIKTATDGKHRLFVAYNAAPAEVDALKAGDISAIVTQHPADEGRLAIRYIQYYVTGKKAKIKSRVAIPPIMVTSAQARKAAFQRYFDRR